MSEIDFRFSPFEEDIVIVGRKGSGKTYRLMWILSLICELCYIVYDYNWILGNFGKIVHRVEDITRGQIIFQPIDKTYQTFIKFHNKIFFDAQKGELSNTVYADDELHQYLTKQRICQEYTQCVMTGRNYGLSGIHISTRPAAIPNNTLSNSSHCFAYQLSNHGDIVWLRDYIGDKAWLLLPKDKRKNFKDKKELTKHSCIYRNQNDPDSQIIICNCADCNKQRSQFPDNFL
jgi:hypothetical protein